MAQENQGTEASAGEAGQLKHQQLDHSHSYSRERARNFQRSKMGRFKGREDRFVGF